MSCGTRVRERGRRRAESFCANLAAQGEEQGDGRAARGRDEHEHAREDDSADAVDDFPVEVLGLEGFAEKQEVPLAARRDSITMRVQDRKHEGVHADRVHDDAGVDVSAEALERRGTAADGVITAQEALLDARLRLDAEIGITCVRRGGVCSRPSVDRARHTHMERR